MELESALRKVRGLIAKAEHEGTPPIEAAEAQRLADEIMRKYKLDQAKLDASRPAEDRIKAEKTEVPLVRYDSDLLPRMANLAVYVAEHCDCKIRCYWRYDSEGVWHARVYGYQSDLRYFEIVYTELRLHMVGVLRPAIDPNKSVELNAYTLHNAGMNWFDIAKSEGWEETPSRPGEAKFMYYNPRTGQRQAWKDCIGKYKFAYQREVVRRGEQPVKIRPGGMNNYRVNAAYGYVRRIDQRLREIREHRQQVGNALALIVDAVEELYRQDAPKPSNQITASNTTTGRRGRTPKIKEIPYNAEAYEAGVRQANTASLNPAASNNPAKEIQ
jgi:Protein of unknown function (DUF2786)